MSDTDMTDIDSSNDPASTVREPGAREHVDSLARLLDDLRLLMREVSERIAVVKDANLDPVSAACFRQFCREVAAHMAVLSALLGGGAGAARSRSDVVVEALSLLEMIDTCGHPTWVCLDLARCAAEGLLKSPDDVDKAVELAQAEVIDRLSDDDELLELVNELTRSVHPGTSNERYLASSVRPSGI